MDTTQESTVKQGQVVATTMLIEKDIAISCRDGSILYCDVFRPPTVGTYPVLMSCGPYGKDLLFETHWPYEYARCEEHGPYMTIETINPESWVSDGYAVVRVDQTGTGKSPGVLDVFSPRDIEHFYDAIEWAGVQLWSNGRVGLIGVSYYSYTQFAVAALRPPHLAAIVPWEVGFDIYRDNVYQGGILSNGFQDFWFTHWILTNQYGKDHLSEEVLAQNWRDWRTLTREHPLFDAFWQARVTDVTAITVPMLTAGNWGGTPFTLRSHVKAFLRASSAHKWLRIHTGGHIEPFYSKQGREEQKRFLDHWLKDLDNGLLDVPPIQLAIRKGKSYEWRYEHEWPLARTTWTKYYLDAATRSLHLEGETAQSELDFSAEPDEAMWQPVTSYEQVACYTQNTEESTSSVSFVSTPFSTDTEITGPIKLRLWVAASAGDTDLFVAVRNLDSQGREITFDGMDNPNVPVTFGWLRLSHRAIDEKRSTEYLPVHLHTAEERLSPGEVVAVDIEVGPTSMVFEAGHRLALEVGSRDLSGSFPLIHNDPQDRRTGGTVTLFTGPAHESYLLLPIIPAASEADLNI